MLAWFNGYSYGALYAEQEGISDWSRVVTAPTLPHYREMRPAKAAVVADPALQDGDYNGAPYIEPAQPADSPDAPSASAGVIELGNPIDERGNPANAAVVRWTDAAEGY